MPAVGGAASIVNDGLVSADLSGRTLTLNNGGGFTNNGILEARNGGVLTLSSGGTSTNNGLIEARTGSTITRRPTLAMPMPLSVTENPSSAMLPARLISVASMRTKPCSVNLMALPIRLSRICS